MKIKDKMYASLAKTGIKINEQISNLVIEDFVLAAEYMPKNVWNINKGRTGGYIQDYATAQKCFRVIGTREQIDKWDKDQTDMMVDEVYDYYPFELGGKGTAYWNGICYNDDPKNTKGLPSRIDYNLKYYESLGRYISLYVENKNEILILRTQ